jgi:MarR family transcriptional regulator, organic hydroperoxide resistance regulator
VVGRAAAKPKSGTSAKETVVALMRAADRVRRRAARIVEPHGITLQQYNVLRILEAARQDGVPTLEVAERMIEETPGVTRLLDRLEAKAYIRRQRCPRDRRQHLCWLTSEGAGLLDKLKLPIANEHERVLERLGVGDRERLAAVLDAIG